MVENVTFGRGVMPQYPMPMAGNPFYVSQAYGQPEADCYCGSKGVTVGGALKTMGIVTALGMGIYCMFKNPEKGKSYFQMLKKDIGELKWVKNFKETNLGKKVCSWFEKAEKPKEVKPPTKGPDPCDYSDVDPTL